MKIMQFSIFMFYNVIFHIILYIFVSNRKKWLHTQEQSKRHPPSQQNTANNLEKF